LISFQAFGPAIWTHGDWPRQVVVVFWLVISVGFGAVSAAFWIAGRQAGLFGKVSGGAEPPVPGRPGNQG
jgi:hypothetical protein